MIKLPHLSKDQHVNINVFGHVQGVFFRRSAKQKAESLEIRGFIMNKPDGTVYIEAEATEEKLKEFISWLESSPQPAKVTSVETEFSDETKGFLEFEIQ
jgi:acylphosphatase